MTRKHKISTAYKAMATIGIHQKKVKPVLENLLMLYNNEWSLIEEENYRALADAIFEEEDAKAEAKKKKCNDYDELNEEAESLLHDEPGPPLKRRLRSQDVSSSQKKISPDKELENNIDEEISLSPRPLKRLRKQFPEGQVPPSANTCNPISCGTSFIRPKVEADELLDTHSPKPPLEISPSPESRGGSLSPILPSGIKSRGKQPMMSEASVLQGKRDSSVRSSHGVRFKETEVQSGTLRLPKQNVGALIKPKDEPFTLDMLQDEAPISMILPEKERSVAMEATTGKQDGGPMSPQDKDLRNDNPVLSSEKSMNCEVATCLEIASSPLGEVKLFLRCNSPMRSPGLPMPNLDALLKLMEDKCSDTIKVIDPNVSLKNLFGRLCESYLELATNSNHETQDGSINLARNLDSLQKSPAWDAVSGNEETFCTASGALNGPVIIERHTAPNGFSVDNSGKLKSLVFAQQCELTRDDLRTVHDVNDISRGEETVNISWVNERSKERLPPFFYIAKNIISKDADVKFCSSSIEDKNCCATCFGNCMSESVPCACARLTGGEFAYTLGGLVKEDFLEESIRISRNPQNHHLFYCKNCPLERVKNADCLEPCKGHLKRKFIKECWMRCGCHRQCGNRVVQRGINCKLQIFLTPDGKGWGLRTLEDLPKGAFVCEFVGEILTNRERYKRNIKSARSGKRLYPVLLDADWGKKADLRDGEALCLDTTDYGNVAKFINHRCLDANLVHIPVEVETADHCYYHVAFFTTKKINAMEELTRDYGIDFDDHDDPVKVFNCRCCSKFCRDMNRSNRSRSASMNAVNVV